MNEFDVDALRDPVPPLPDVGRRAAVAARARSLRARSRANRLALSSLSILAVLALVAGIVASRRGDDPRVIVEGGPTSTAPSSIADRFVPPTTTEDGITTVPVTLPDGEQLRLRYPQTMGIAQLGFAGGINVDWPVETGPLRCCGRQVSVRYATIADVYGNAKPVNVYRGANGEDVPYFHGSQRVQPVTATLDYLVFQFGPWLVEVYDVQQAGDYEQRMTDEQRATWARSLSGTVDADGWLVLHATAPLALGNRFDGVFGSNPMKQVELAAHLYCGQKESDSTAHRRFVDDDGTHGVSWCVDDDLHVSATGTKRFIDTVDAQLEVSPLIPAPNGASVDLLTQAHGYGRETALGSGVLRFDAERACSYLERPDGTRLLPQWPEGYHARRDPLRVYDAADTLVATENQVITFSGGYHDPAALGPGEETCGVDTVDGLFVMGSPIRRDQVSR